MNVELEQTPWQRLRTLRPQLRPHAEIRRHHYRGRACFLLTDGMTGEHHTFDKVSFESEGCKRVYRALKKANSKRKG